MLRVTFYSYKGGVGRTLALLNVASILARSGRRVVAVDLDLEAPGFGLSSLTARQGQEGLGVSDLLLSRRAGGDLPIERCVYPILDAPYGEHLRLMPAGIRVAELTRRLPGLYADLDGDAADLFQLLVAEIESAFEPDYLLFDSRTGRADIAGVCTIELPQVVVAVCGLNEQNVLGMEQALRELIAHPARVEPAAILLVLSPVPRPGDLKLPPVEDLFPRLSSRFDPVEIERTRASNPLIDALYRAQVRLMPLIRREFEKVRPLFLGADRSDLYHELFYDPMVPLTDELQLTRDVALRAAYRRLARSLTRVHPKDNVLDMPEMPHPLVLIP